MPQRLVMAVFINTLITNILVEVMHFPFSASQLHFRGHNQEQSQPDTYESKKPGQSLNQTIALNECVVDISAHLNKTSEAQQVLPMAAPTSHELFKSDALQNIMTHITKQPDGLALTAQLKSVSRTFNKEAEHSLVSEKKLMRDLMQQLNQGFSSLQNNIKNMDATAIIDYLKSKPSEVDLVNTYRLIKNQPISFGDLKNSQPITFEDLTDFRQKFSIEDLNDKQLLKQFSYFSALHIDHSTDETNKLNDFFMMSNELTSFFKSINFVGLKPPILYGLYKAVESTCKLDQFSTIPATIALIATAASSTYLAFKASELISHLEINTLNECRTNRTQEHLHMDKQSFDPSVDYIATAALLDEQQSL